MKWSETVVDELIPILKTGTVVSAVSYVFFFVVEWMRPGFVSNVFSVHVFLFSALLFGCLWGIATQKYPSEEEVSHRLSLGAFLSACIFGLLLAWFAWTEGRSLGDFRLLLVLISFVAPFLVAGVIRRG